MDSSERGLSLRLRKLIQVGLLSSLAACFMILLQVPLFPSAPFLTYDPSEVPAILAAFSLGPLWGVGVVLIKNLLFVMLRFQPVELVGLPLNTLAGATLVWVAGAVYARRRRPVPAVMFGTLAATAVMMPVNLLAYPLVAWLFALPVPAGLTDFVLFVVTPFNLVKGLLSGALACVVYRKLRHLTDFFRSP
ncbi:MAG: ECF transporter S component [Armatimonadetes bacterium]|nr:ECF transporter S component [Armatimonadota bacterium]